jgi:tetratricopeptide (TPR) repeat protein
MTTMVQKAAVLMTIFFAGLMLWWLVAVFADDPSLSDEIERGNSLLAQGEFERALEAYASLGEVPEGMFRTAITLYFQAKAEKNETRKVHLYRDCVKVLIAVAALSEGNRQLHSLLDLWKANCLSQLGFYDLAITQYAEAAKNTSNSQMAIANLATLENHALELQNTVSKREESERETRLEYLAIGQNLLELSDRKEVEPILQYLAQRKFQIQIDLLGSEPSLSEIKDLGSEIQQDANNGKYDRNVQQNFSYYVSRIRALLHLHESLWSSDWIDHFKNTQTDCNDNLDVWLEKFGKGLLPKDYFPLAVAQKEHREWESFLCSWLLSRNPSERHASASKPDDSDLDLYEIKSSIHQLLVELPGVRVSMDDDEVSAQMVGAAIEHLRDVLRVLKSNPLGTASTLEIHKLLTKAALSLIVPHEEAKQPPPPPTPEDSPEQNRVEDKHITKGILDATRRQEQQHHKSGGTINRPKNIGW